MKEKNDLKNDLKDVKKLIKLIKKLRKNNRITGRYFEFKHVNSFCISLQTLKDELKKQH